MTTTTVFLRSWDDDNFTKAAEFDQPTGLITDLMDGKPIRALEDVFCQLNIDEPTAPWAIDYRANRNRSLSVNDVVVIGETAWRCAPFGWQRTTLDSAQIGR